ncbi:hypothetical protein K449DRAFT_417994 [Hypoxylon sp. EC38]|nr:hypothetical protein K449DRAFT_417994 [Hypoxylon sp. EC38]
MSWNDYGRRLLQALFDDRWKYDERRHSSITYQASEYCDIVTVEEKFLYGERKMGMEKVWNDRLLRGTDENGGMNWGVDGELDKNGSSMNGRASITGRGVAFARLQVLVPFDWGQRLV